MMEQLALFVTQISIDVWNKHSNHSHRSPEKIPPQATQMEVEELAGSPPRQAPSTDVTYGVPRE